LNWGIQFKNTKVFRPYLNEGVFYCKEYLRGFNSRQTTFSSGPTTCYVKNCTISNKSTSLPNCAKKLDKQLLT